MPDGTRKSGTLVLDGNDLDLDLRVDAGLGEVEVARSRELRPPGPGPDVPRGRDLGDAEAAARMADVAGVPGLGEAVAQVAARLAAEGVTHRITDEEALAHLRRRARTGEPALVEGPARPDRPRPPDNLPALMGRDVFARDPHWAPDNGPVEPDWFTIYNTPGWMSARIRQLGETTFSIFPCFQDQYRSAAQTGEDPLGSVRLLARLGGRGPSRQTEIDHVARWVVAHGVVVDVAQLTFPRVIDGYSPRVILAAYGDTSYLLVDEKAADGAPADSQYVYSWKGGMDFYARHGLAVADLGRLALPEGAARNARVVQALPAPGRVAARRPGHPVLPRPAGAPALPPPAPVGTSVAQVAAGRKAAVSRLTEAPATVTTSDMLLVFREAGFTRRGTPKGPVMVLERPDGRIEASPPEGHTLTNASSFELVRYDTAGTQVETGTATEASDLADFMSVPATPTP